MKKEELSENTTILLSIKTLITIGLVLFSAFGFYYKVMTDIEEAKTLPLYGTGLYSVDPTGNWPPSRNEYNMKDQMSRNKIVILEKEITELKESIKELRSKIYDE